MKSPEVSKESKIRHSIEEEEKIQKYRTKVRLVLYFIFIFCYNQTENYNTK